MARLPQLLQTLQYKISDFCQVTGELAILGLLSFRTATLTACQPTDTVLSFTECCEFLRAISLIVALCACLFCISAFSLDHISWYSNCLSERSALSGAFLHCFILFVFCFYICIAFLLIFVPLKEYYSASTPPSPKGNFQNSNFPKFQFSKIQIFQKNQRNQKNQLCQDFASPPLPPMVCAELVFVGFFGFFGKLEFWIF